MKERGYRLDVEPAQAGGRTWRMHEQPDALHELLARAAANDSAAIGELFHLHRDRLRRMIQLRLDRRLHGQLDPSDVFQESFLEYARSLLLQR